jgi:predicted nucleic acid-binding protein
MIISDATILITLINIDEFRVLKLFINSIIIPHEVYDEVSQKPSAKKYLDDEVSKGFITVESYENDSLFREINYILDAGESASITLAIEKKLPLIIDERKGRKFAQKQGVEIIGLVGILRFLYVESRLRREEVLVIIEKLNGSDFRVSSKLLGLILAEVL